MGKEDNSEYILEIAFNAFSEKFASVNSFKDSDVQMSTFELCTMFQEFTMKTISGLDLIELMNNNGYICQTIEKRILWLLKSK